ncbi:MAG TPA: serine hydrolase [Candidatus Eisenbacteria bacterium]|nr:serine hydrolase [Candidatus Eisenbacteria bacterium]
MTEGTRRVSAQALLAGLVGIFGVTHAQAAAPGAHPLVPPSIVGPLPGTHPFFAAPLDSGFFPTLSFPEAPPTLRARECGVFDVRKGAWIFAKNVYDPVPVASLTKLAAALTFVRLTPDLDQLITITEEDWVHAGRSRLRVGDRLPARTLLRLALVASDNCAVRALTHPSGLTWEAYAYVMEQTAWSLGCRNTRFAEPCGLDERNVASAHDVVLLFRAAMKHPLLKECMGTSQFTLETRRGPRPISHSARLLRYRDDIVAAKTGYTDEAGYCLVQCVADPDGDFVTVVLGEPSEGARTRESMKLIEYTRAMRKKGT